MLKRTSFIVAGASLAIMSCAIAGGDPDANANASGTNNTSSAQATTSTGTEQATDSSQNTSAADTSTNSGTSSQNEARAGGGSEQGFEAV